VPPRKTTPQRKSTKAASAKSRTEPPAKPAVDLHAMGARVVSVFGPFNSRVLIEMAAETAQEMFPDPLAISGHTNVIDGAGREVESIRKRDEELAESALAASAVALAREIEHPYNSATSKSMCAREMRDTLDRLRELVPPAERKDKVDEVAAKRASRRATVPTRRTGTKGKKGT